MYTVIGSPRTRAGRVMWMLEELGEAYDVIPAGPLSPEAFEANPTGKVPALKDGETIITDSLAIIMHLADKHQQFTYPLGSPERAELMSVIFFAADAIEGPLWQFAKHNFVYPEELRALDAALPGLRHEFDKAIAQLEEMLGDKTYITGDDFTVADIVLGHLGGWAKGAGFGEPGGKVGEYMSRIRSRPAWKAVLKKRAA